MSDLVIVVRAGTEREARAALDRAETLLTARREAAAAGPEPPPRSLTGAVRRAPGANLALISVPGTYAAAEAHQALAAGLHVFLFSDGVALEDEVLLKRRGRGRGLLVMGPECGTAIVDGVGLGFANRVRRGPVGLVGAAGTGLQEVTSLIHRFGSGVSHAIGTGGRDLHGQVGGLTTLQALEVFGHDEGSRAIVVVSKPPSPTAATRVLTAAAATGKPVVACLIGWRGTAPGGVHAVTTLEEAARAAVEAVGATPVALPALPTAPSPARGSVVGLFTGGSLCEEAQAIVGEGRHRFVDFGSADYTRGRAHPMIDPSLRNAAVRAAAAEPDVGVLLLDVVLGDGAHADPAAALLPAVREAGHEARRRGQTLHVVAHVVGTDEDPQRLSDQETHLREHGVLVCATNRQAAALARRLAGGV